MSDYSKSLLDVDFDFWLEFDKVVNEIKDKLERDSDKKEPRAKVSA